MRLGTSFIVIALVSAAISFKSCKQKEQRGKEVVLELPIHVETGFGPFEGSYSLLHDEYKPDNVNGAPWIPTYLPVKGIPVAWRDVNKSMVWLDAHQLVYQNFHAGKIAKEMYEGLMKSWEWTPDERILSQKPMRCYVYVIWGTDKAGKVAMMIDKNNNLDFTDEIAFYPETLDHVKDGKNKGSMHTYKQTHTVQYDVFRDGKIVQESVMMIVKYASEYEEGMQYWYSFPHYGKTTLSWKGKEYPIGINNYFSNVNFRESRIFLLDDNTKGPRSRFQEGIEPDEFLEIGGPFNKVKFRNMGVNLIKNTLILKEETGDVETFSLQKGYLFKPFREKEFLTGKPISLRDFQGKYVFVDFWGTWCKGCVEQLPELRALYQEVDKQKVAFVGIALDKPANLSRFLKKQPLEWPQIISDTINRLVETYNIAGYPTNVIVGPDGRIVAKNLSGVDLKVKLQQLSNIKTL